MGKLKLTVNEEKERRVCRVPTEGEFDFLGYTSGRMYSARTGQARLGIPAIKGEQQAHGRATSTRSPTERGQLARNREAGGQGEPHAARMGELLPSRHPAASRIGHSTANTAMAACAEVVRKVERQRLRGGLASGGDLSTLAPLPALLAALRFGTVGTTCSWCEGRLRRLVPAKAGMRL